MKRILIMLFLLSSSVFANPISDKPSKLVEIMEKGDLKAFQIQIKKVDSLQTTEALKAALINEDERFLKTLLKNKNVLKALDTTPGLAALPLQESKLKNFKILLVAKPKLLKTTELENHRSLLHEAVTYSNLELIRFIVEKDSSLLARVDDAGESVLFSAARRGEQEIATYLVSLKTDRSLKNKAGQSAADIASSEGFPKTAKVLQPK